MEKQLVMITQERLDELLDYEAKLCSLYNGGVEDWEWYGDSLQQYKDWKEGKYEL